MNYQRIIINFFLFIIYVKTINPLLSDVTSLHDLETSESLWFSDVLIGQGDAISRRDELRL